MYSSGSPRRFASSRIALRYARTLLSLLWMLLGGSSRAVLADGGYFKITPHYLGTVNSNTPSGSGFIIEDTVNGVSIPAGVQTLDLSTVPNSPSFTSSGGIRAKLLVHLKVRTAISA